VPVDRFDRNPFSRPFLFAVFLFLALSAPAVHAEEILPYEPGHANVKKQMGVADDAVREFKDIIKDLNCAELGKVEKGLKDKRDKASKKKDKAYYKGLLTELYSVKEDNNCD